jgi:DNA polymerase III epsilon subunit-like protein
MSQDHKLTKNQDDHYCELCECTFKQSPSGSCPGVKVYSYSSIPWEQITTSTQLKERKLKPRDAKKPDGCYFRLRDKEYIFLYRIDEALPRRKPTEKQRQAISKMQEGLRLKYTCQRCGWYDRTHGQSRSKYYEGNIYTLRVDEEDKLYCEDCRRYMIWCHDRHVIEYNMDLLFHERSKPWLVLDTETTSLPDQQGFQVVEIACVDKTGAVIFHSLIKPDAPITPTARRKHGITDEMLKSAPSFPDIWEILLKILSEYELWTYGSAFDRDAIISSAERYGIEVPKKIRNPNRWNCLMETFADYYGMWSAYHNTYKYQELWSACQHLEVPGNGYHRAREDALNALGIMKALAARGGTYPIPEEQPAYVRSEYDPEDDNY